MFAVCGITAYCRLEPLSGCSCVQQLHTDRHVNVCVKCATHIQSPFQGHICNTSRQLFRASKNKSCLLEWGYPEISNCLSSSQSNQQLPQSSQAVTCKHDCGFVFNSMCICVMSFIWFYCVCIRTVFDYYVCMCAGLLQWCRSPAGRTVSHHVSAHPVWITHNPCPDRLSSPPRSFLQRKRIR